MKNGLNTGFSGDLPSAENVLFGGGGTVKPCIFVSGTECGNTSTAFRDGLWRAGLCRRKRRRLIVRGIVKYPEAVKIGGSAYHYFILWADEAHIEQIGNTLTFLKKQIGAEKRSDTSTEGIAKLVEENLAIIMSSPKQASNPHAYIQAHQEEYENIKNRNPHPAGMV